MIAVTDQHPLRRAKRWDEIAGDLADAIGARPEDVQVLSVILDGAGREYRVHVEIACPSVVQP